MYFGMLIGGLCLCLLGVCKEFIIFLSLLSLLSFSPMLSECFWKGIVCSEVTCLFKVSCRHINLFFPRRWCEQQCSCSCRQSVLFILQLIQPLQCSKHSSSPVEKLLSPLINTFPDQQALQQDLPWFVPVCTTKVQKKSAHKWSCQTNELQVHLWNPEGPMPLTQSSYSMSSTRDSLHFLFSALQHKNNPLQPKQIVFFYFDKNICFKKWCMKVYGSNLAHTWTNQKWLLR